ncbi:MAG: Dna2/Cas4 domain-containing protein [Candidatus Poseidonia sp.]|nr:Dna2/Cas4 domain-containing protein [Poseidonia sp.]
MTEEAAPEYPGSKPTHSKAKMDDNGIWKNVKGEPLAVSASDLERFVYCPLSWSLSNSGHAGTGAAIEEGIERHRTIHEEMTELQFHQQNARRNLIIWRWWYAIILFLFIDAILFFYLNDQNVSIDGLSKVLALWALSCLIVGMLAIYLPWRKWIGMEYDTVKMELRLQEASLVEPLIEPSDFEGGWYEGGRIEVSLLVAAIALAIHSMAFRFADDRQQASFILAVTAMMWTFMASYLLQRALISNSEVTTLSSKSGLDPSTSIAYSDNESTSNLLSDPATGLRGRPDQIVIIDGEFIPVEQKTGRTPKTPHESHAMQVMAYIHLVEMTTNQRPPYGLLRYGSEDIHSITWDDDAQSKLLETIKSVQEFMVKGGAKRNHERPGKCKNCSRRYACPDSLIEA